MDNVASNLTDSTPARLFPAEITSALLSKLLDSMSEGQDLVFSKTSTGDLNMFLRYSNGKKMVRKPFKSMLFTKPKTEPVKSPWSRIGDITELDLSRRSIRRKEAKKKEAILVKKIDAVSAGITMEIMTVPDELFVKMKTAHGDRLEYTFSNGRSVICNTNKRPLMYKDPGDKDFTFLPNN